MIVGVLKETYTNERRVAVVPRDVSKLKELGFEVLVESNAGKLAYFEDEEYESEGARIEDRKYILSNADIILKINPPETKEVEYIKDGALIVAFLYEWKNEELKKAVLEKHIRYLALEKIPRTTKAQFVDVLSSQATLAGYKAVLIAGELSPKLFPMLTTAAGTVKPANVLVIGVGVAGLQALATAKRIGANTFAYDIRPETKTEAESVGAKFLQSPVIVESKGGYARELTDEEKQKQYQFLKDNVARMDVVITTAQVPGRPAPKIITKDMVDGMKKGSVIVDIASDNGGNCELTEPGRTIEYNGVIISGPLNVPSMLPITASEMFSKNMFNLLKLIKEHPEMDDEILEAMLVKGGE